MKDLKKYLIVLVLAIAVAFCLGCNKDESAAPAGGGDEDSPTAGAMGPNGGMPGGMPGGPSGMPGGMPGGPSGMPGMDGGMPGMDGGMGGATTPAAEPAQEVKLKTLEEEFPSATVKRDETGEVRSFYNPSAMNKVEGKHLSELQSREAALAFIRQYYYYFDTMSFEFRPSAGELNGGVYSFMWYQKVRDTKKTGNEINITVNPYSGLVVKYNSTRKNWDN